MGGNPWITGDWLIRYTDGFVRRGLLGEMATLLSDISGAGLLIVVTALQITLFSIFVFFSTLLFWSSPRGPARLMLVCSPAFVAFPFWDFQGGFRKEIFALAALSALLWWSTRSIGTAVQRWGFCASWSIAPALFTLAHEGLAFFSPLILVAFGLVRSQAGISTRAFWFVTGSGAILTFVSVIAAVRFPGDRADAESSCASAVSRGLEAKICSAGALEDFGRDLSGAFTVVEEKATPLYLLLGLLALVPFLLMGPSKRLLVSTLGALTALTPLFVIGSDWGRWIHIAMSVLTLAALAAPQNFQEGPLSRPPLKKLSNPLLLIHALGWHLPHVFIWPYFWGPGPWRIALSVLEFLRTGPSIE